MRNKFKHFILPFTLALCFAVCGLFSIGHMECTNIVSASQDTYYVHDYQHNLVLSSRVSTGNVTDKALFKANLFNVMNTATYTDYNTTTVNSIAYNYGYTISRSNTFVVPEPYFTNLARRYTSTLTGFVFGEDCYFKDLTFTSPAFNRLSAEYLPILMPNNNYIYDGYCLYTRLSLSGYIQNIHITFDYTIQDVDSTDTLHTFDSDIRPLSYTSFLNKYNIDSTMTMYGYNNTFGESAQVIEFVPLDPLVNYSIYNYSCTITYADVLTALVADDEYLQFEYYSIMTTQPDLRLPTTIQYVDNTNWFEGIATAVDNFLSIELLPDLSFYDILILAIAIPVLIWILKAWLGG